MKYYDSTRGNLADEDPVLRNQLDSDEAKRNGLVPLEKELGVLGEKMGTELEKKGSGLESSVKEALKAYGNK